MSTAVKGLTVDQYDRMVEKGILPETNRFELIEGRIVEKDVKKPAHPTATRRTMRDRAYTSRRLARPQGRSRAHPKPEKRARAGPGSGARRRRCL